MVTSGPYRTEGLRILRNYSILAEKKMKFFVLLCMFKLVFKGCYNHKDHGCLIDHHVT
jgi:hypothetical protein